MRYAACLSLLVLVGLVQAADEKLDGKWIVQSMEQSGKVEPRYKGAIREHNGEEIKMTLKDGASIEATMKIDAEKKTLDINPSSGTYKDKTLLAIYEIKGDTLKICFAEPGKDRPKAFSSKDGAVVFTLKRAK